MIRVQLEQSLRALTELSLLTPLSHLKRVQHALAGDDDLLRLLLHGEGADEGGHLLRRLPLGQLAQTLLPGPHRGVDDLEEELSRARVEDEDGSVDRLGCQVTLEGLGEGRGGEGRGGEGEGRGGGGEGRGEEGRG